LASIPLARSSRPEASLTRSVDLFAPLAARGLWAAAIILVVGTAFDLGILWLAQRQDTLQWEFVATTNTIEAFARPVIALGLMYAALSLGRIGSLAAYRAMAVFALLLGVGGALLGTLLLLDYLALSGSVNPEGIAVFRSTVAKAGTLALLYFVILVPVGIMGLRRPKNRA